MKSGDPEPVAERIPGSSDDMLRRILVAVEDRKRKPVLELLTAVILSLATVGSAWCAYQAKLWGGAQNARTNAGFRAGREAAFKSLTAIQTRAFDATMFIHFISARVSGNKDLEDFLRKRFRSDMKPAVEAWLALENDPTAPSSPFVMSEYVQKEVAEAAKQNELADRALAASREARRFSDNYTLHTVIFASVLFFGGISRNFGSRRVQMFLMTAATLLFAVTLYTMVTLPVCHE